VEPIAAVVENIDKTKGRGVKHRGNRKYKEHEI